MFKIAKRWRWLQELAGGCRTIVGNMSCTYADGLSPYENKGKCGLPETFDDDLTVEEKVKSLAEIIRSSHYVVVHTGAGISTSAGIPDFRGPKGVWTLEEKGEKPNLSLSFNDAKPTVTHMALKELANHNIIKYVITQNVDGLHLRSGFPRSKLAELHGNMFIEECDQCHRQFVRSSAAPTVGQKCLNKPCPKPKSNGRPCRGRLHDSILDWEAELPYYDLQQADYHSSKADLSICLGTTLQIVPSGNLPLNTKRNKGKLIICNLQPTKHDKRADLIIHTYVDNLMTQLLKALGISLPPYNPDEDPACAILKQEQDSEAVTPWEWTLTEWQLLKKPDRKKPFPSNESHKTKFKKEQTDSTNFNTN